MVPGGSAGQGPIVRAASRRGKRPLRARLRDLLCEVTTTQTYRNLEEVPIEAVYTFALPLGAGSAVVGVLRQLIAAGRDEPAVVVVFLHLLAEAPTGAALGCNARRAITRAYKALAAAPAVLAGLRLDLVRKLPPTALGAPTQTFETSLDGP